MYVHNCLTIFVQQILFSVVAPKSLKIETTIKAQKQKHVMRNESGHAFQRLEKKEFFSNRGMSPALSAVKPHKTFGLTDSY